MDEGRKRWCCPKYPAVSKVVQSNFSGIYVYMVILGKAIYSLLAVVVALDQNCIVPFEEI